MAVTEAPEGGLRDKVKEFGSSLSDPKTLTSLALPLILGIISKGRAKKLGFTEPPAKAPGPLAAPEKGILSGPTDKAISRASRPYRSEAPLHEDVVQSLREKLLERPELSQSTIGEGGSMTRVANRLRPEAKEIARQIKRPESTQLSERLKSKESAIRQDFYQKHGRQPSEAMVAYRMGMSTPEYRKMHQVSVPPKMATSLKTGSANEERPATPEIVDQPQQTKGDMTPSGMSIEDRVSFKKALSTLQPIERKILLSIFSESEELPHGRIAKDLGVSPATVSRMYTGAIKKLQKVLGVSASSGKTKDKPSLRKAPIEGGGLQASSEQQTPQAQNGPASEP